MADVGWAPILDRMDAARWWSEIDPKAFPRGYFFKYDELQQVTVALVEISLGFILYYFDE